MDIEAKVARYGNSLTIRLPIAVARALDFRDGDSVVLRVEDGGVRIEPKQMSRLARRLLTVTAPEAEISTGVAVGAEVFD